MWLGRRVVSNYAVGYDNIECPRCQRARRFSDEHPVCVLTDATADMAFAQLMAAPGC